MPDVSLSVKGLAELVRASTKAFDDLYSLLQRMALDGWSAGQGIFLSVQTHREATAIRPLILILRNLQISKLSAAHSISTYCDSPSIGNWEGLQSALAKSIREVIETIDELQSYKLNELVISLRSTYPELATSLLTRQDLLLRTTDERPRGKDAERVLLPLAGFLEREAVSINRCANLMTEYLSTKAVKS